MSLQTGFCLSVVQDVRDPHHLATSCWMFVTRLVDKFLPVYSYLAANFSNYYDSRLYQYRFWYKYDSHLAECHHVQPVILKKSILRKYNSVELLESLR